MILKIWNARQLFLNNFKILKIWRSRRSDFMNFNDFHKLKGPKVWFSWFQWFEAPYDSVVMLFYNFEKIHPSEGEWSTAGVGPRVDACDHGTVCSIREDIPSHGYVDEPHERSSRARGQLGGNDWVLLGKFSGAVLQLQQHHTQRRPPGRTTTHPQPRQRPTTERATQYTIIST